MKDIYYQKKIENIIECLGVIYEEAPTQIIEKYKYLFDSFDEISPIMYPYFTYYPKTRIIENMHGEICLTKTHGKIFNSLAKGLRRMKYVPKDYLYSCIFSDKKNKMPLDKKNPMPFVSFNVHLYHMNKHLKHLKIKISNIHCQGVFLEYISNEIDDKLLGESIKYNNSDWIPYVVKQYVDPFHGKTW